MDGGVAGEQLHHHSEPPGHMRRSGDFAGGSVTSFAEDADKNALLLATDGVYMVVRPSLCDVKYKYKTCNCFNRTIDITVNTDNMNIHNGENEIQLTVISTQG